MKLDGYLIDIDGTLLSGSTAFDGAREFLEALSDEQTPWLLMTNGISPPTELSRRLADAGLAVPPRKILNPISAINCSLARDGIQRCLVVGSAAEKAQIEAEVVTEKAEVVVLLDFEKDDLGFSSLQRIVEMASSGIPVIAASGSKFYLKAGKRTIDTGSFVALVEGVTGLPIKVLGKPSVDYFCSAFDLLGCAPHKVLVVGDDWSTDIVGGRTSGAQTALVRTGKYQAGDENKGSPTLVVERLIDLTRGPSEFAF